MKELVQLVKKLLARVITAWLFPLSPSKRKQVAIFKPDAIGDFVLTSKAIELIISEYGPNNVTLIVSRHVYDLAEFLFPTVEIVSVDLGQTSMLRKLYSLARLRRRLQDVAYDEVLCLRHYRNLFDEIIIGAISARRKIVLVNQFGAFAGSRGALRSEEYCLVNSPIVETFADALPRELHFHAEVLSTLLSRRIDANLIIPDLSPWAAVKHTSSPFLLIAPLAGNKIRHAPQRLVEAAACAAADHGLVQIVLTGSNDQKSELGYYADTLKARLPTAQIEIIHPPTLRALLTLVANSSLVVSAETSIAHIATALDQNALLLIGGGHFGWFAPWSRSSKQVWVTNEMACFGCGWKCPFSEPYCLTNITNKHVTDLLPIG